MPGISGADLRYIQQRYMDSHDDELIFDIDEFPEEAEGNEPSPPVHNKEARENVFSKTSHSR